MEAEFAPPEFGLLLAAEAKDGQRTVRQGIGGEIGPRPGLMSGLGQSGRGHDGCQQEGDEPPKKGAAQAPYFRM